MYVCVTVLVVEIREKLLGVGSLLTELRSNSGEPPWLSYIIFLFCLREGLWFSRENNKRKIKISPPP